MLGFFRRLLPGRKPAKEGEIARKMRKQVRLLQHRNAKVREEAVKELYRVGHERAVPHLVHALRDREVHVRWYAVRSLGMVEHERVIPHLAKALRDKNDSVRLIAAEELGRIGRSIQGKEVKSAKAKTLQLVGAYFRPNEEPETIRQAYQAALEGKVTPANIRLYLKQLRALKGNVK